MTDEQKQWERAGYALGVGRRSKGEGDAFSSILASCCRWAKETNKRVHLHLETSRKPLQDGERPEDVMVAAEIQMRPAKL